VVLVWHNSAGLGALMLTITCGAQSAHVLWHITFRLATLQPATATTQLKVNIGQNSCDHHRCTPLCSHFDALAALGEGRGGGREEEGLSQR
jgi:hypothetical protein